MKMRAVLLSCLVSSLAAACANFKAVSDFASETQGLTSTVRTEFNLLSTLCVEQARLSIAILDIQSGSSLSPLKACASYSATQGRLAEVTVDVLDAYAKALLALAEDRSFDLGPELQSTSNKLAALRTQDGTPLVNPEQLGALTKVVLLLADIATQARRETAIRRLIDEKPNLVVNAQIMRSFFARPAGADPALKTPYENVVKLSSDALQSYETILSSDPMRKAEPIRTRELLMTLEPTKETLKARQSGKDDGVPARIVAAIDAWISAADSFEREALTPDPRQLYARLSDLRIKAISARDAVRARSN